jgi:hypothetical protein
LWDFYLKEGMKMKRLSIVCTLLLVLPCIALAQLPDTGQTKCYDDDSEITCPNPGEAFYGQDAQYNNIRNQQSYTKLDGNGDDLPEVLQRAEETGKKLGEALRQGWRLPC